MVRAWWVPIIWLGLFMMMTACQPATGPLQEDLAERSWEQVSRGIRIVAEVVQRQSEQGQIFSLTLLGLENKSGENQPVGAGFVGQTIDVALVEPVPMEQVPQRWGEGTRVAITIARYAKPDGQVVFGTRPEWVYAVMDGGYMDWQGNRVPAADGRS